MMVKADYPSRCRGGIWIDHQAHTVRILILCYVDYIALCALHRVGDALNYDKLAYFATVRHIKHNRRNREKSPYYTHYVTIPKKEREKLNVDAGSEVHVTIRVMQR